MFINRISTENWVGNQNLERTLENADWNLINDSILDLDGKTKTMVTLETDGVAHMAIGGGYSGLYVVYATFDNEIFYSLIDSLKSANRIKMAVGGQYGDYPERMCVGIDKVISAAKAFAEKGEIEKSLEWEEN